MNTSTMYKKNVTEIVHDGCQWNIAIVKWEESSMELQPNIRWKVSGIRSLWLLRITLSLDGQSTE